MSKKEQKAGRNVDPAELRELGFSEELIREAVKREQSGLLAIEPPQDLVESTIRACADLFSIDEGRELVPRPAVQETEPANFFSIALQLLSAVTQADPSLAFRGAAAVYQCWRLGEWPRRLAMDSIRFALSAHQRPLVTLENHTLTSPSWWEEDEEFQKIKVTFHTLNEFVSSTGIERSARIVVLRPNISDYSQAEIGAIEALTREGTSDIWWLPFSSAAKYSRENIVVIGDECVLRLRYKSHSPAEALQAMEYSQDTEFATRVRREITTEMCGYAVPVKIHGQLQPFLARALNAPQGIQLALRRVIESRDAETTSSDSVSHVT